MTDAFTHATGGAVPAPATPQGGRRPVCAPRRLIDPDDLTALIADGLSVTECAARMGFTPAAVTAAVKRWNLTPTDQRKSPAYRAKAAAKARARWADPVYAARMGAHLRRANRKRWQA